MPDQPDTGGGQPGAGNPDAGKGAPESAPGVDLEAVKAAVAESLKAELSQQVTGAVKRQIASALDGVDLDALRAKPDAPKSGDGNDKGTKVNPLEVKLSEQQKQIDALTKAADRYRRRALRGGVTEIVGGLGLTKSAAELLIDSYAAKVQEDDEGKLYVQDGDSPVLLVDHLKAYVKDRPDLLKSEARGGSGAGAQTGGWTEAMPASMAELMKDPKTGRPTPERWARFKRAHPERAAELRKAAGGTFSGGAIEAPGRPPNERQ